MSWLAKINLGVMVERIGRIRSALLLLSIIVVCIFCGYRVGNYYHHFQKQTIEQQKQRLAGLYKELQQQNQRINTLEVELEVERLTSQSSMELLKELEVESFQIKKELAFYEKVMAPEKQADGLVVDKIKITPTTSADHYRFQIILVQQQIKKRFAKGYVTLSFKGSLANKPSELALSKISTITRKELSFSLKYFQIIEGEFTLPSNFKAESLDLSVILPKGKWQKYQKMDHDYQWNDVLSE